MDQTDDFQFKPITEGLGFNKTKEVQTKENQFNQAPAKKIARELAQEIHSPLPRPESKKQDVSINDTNETIDEILKTLHNRKKYEIIEKQTAPKIPKSGAVIYKASYLELTAGLLDSMLIIAAQLLCLIVLLSVTQIDLFASLTNPDQEGMIYIALAAQFASITWIYFSATRVFMGQTPGEWVFDQRLGTPEMMKSPTYGLKAIARASVVVATGFIFIPLLSWAIGRDLIGQLLGLQLVKKA